VTTLYVVTLYPYEDGSEARYQFDREVDAQTFAAKVKALPAETLAYVTGTGKPIPPEVWESGTYGSVDEAWAALTDYLPDEDKEPCPHEHVLKDDDGRDNWFYVCDDCDTVVRLTEPDEDGHSTWEAIE
jgi:hypothetical protein